MDKSEYLKIGVKGVGKDKKITREEVKKIEERVNDHTRFWIKMTNIGENNGHHNRMKESKLSHSEQMAPRYYMYKDHKREGGWRPVVSGCNSHTLDLSNLLSEVIESLCISIENPYEVISSTDMLSRIKKFNCWVEEERKERGKDWDWRLCFNTI